MAMVVRETFREACSSLWGAKQRSLLALLGIVIGIGSVMTMVSIGELVRNESLRQFEEMGTDIVSISLERDSSGTSSKKGFRMSDVLGIPERCPAIQEVAPYVMVSGPGRIEGNQVYLSALGTGQAYFDVNRLPLAEGRAISDLDAMMYYCVVGQELYATHFAPGSGSVIGQQVLFENRVFTIIGVLEQVPYSMMRGTDLNESLLLPITTALRLENAGRIDTVMARLAPQQEWATALTQLQAYFAPRLKGQTVTVRSAEELLRQAENQMRLFSLLLGAIGSISLVVGGVGVMNVMLVSVTERKREIGIRRALGARRPDIQFQFLIESVCLCLAGGVLGIALGLGASVLFARLNGWEFMVSWFAATLGVGVSTLVGVFFGIYPARQAARLKPIEALRDA